MVNQYKVKTKKKRSDISCCNAEQDYKLIKNIYEKFHGSPPIRKIIDYYDSRLIRREIFIDNHLKNKLNNINVKYKTDV